MRYPGEPEQDEEEQLPATQNEPTDEADQQDEPIEPVSDYSPYSTSVAAPRITGQNAKGTASILNAARGTGKGFGAVPSLPQPAERGQPDQTPGMPRFFLESGQELQGTRLDNGQIDYHTRESPTQAYNRMQEQMIQNLPPALQGQFRLQQLQLSQVEQLQLQKMRNSLAAIDAAPLTPDEKAHAKMLLQTGINPLELRKAQAQGLALDLKNQQEKAEIQRRTDNALWVRKFNAEKAGQTITAENDPHDPEARGYFLLDDKGNPKEIPGLPGSKGYEDRKSREETSKANRETREETARLARETAADKKELSLRAEDERHWSTHIDDAEKFAQARLLEVEKDPDTKKQFDENNGFRTEFLKKKRQEYLNTQDTHPVLETHLANRAARRKKEGEIGTVDKQGGGNAGQPQPEVVGQIEQDHTAGVRKAIAAQDWQARDSIVEMRKMLLENASGAKNVKEIVGNLRGEKLERIKRLAELADPYMGK